MFVRLTVNNINCSSTEMKFNVFCYVVIFYILGKNIKVLFLTGIKLLNARTLFYIMRVWRPLENHNIILPKFT